MREYHKQHHHHRRPRRRGGEAWHSGCDAELRAPGRKFRRRFATRDERIARLGTYLSELRSEAQAVEEHIAELKAAGDS
ncbi:hypothetical protein ACFLUM_02880 [Chloroflexota bacterium]